MQIVQALSQISTKLLNGFLRQLFILFDQLIEVTASAIFKNDPEMIASLIPVIKLKNMPVFKTMKYADLVQNFLAPVFLDGFDGDVIDGFFLAAL